jgi:hypothetical protein
MSWRLHLAVQSLRCQQRVSAFCEQAGNGMFYGKSCDVRPSRLSNISLDFRFLFAILLHGRGNGKQVAPGSIASLALTSRWPPVKAVSVNNGCPTRRCCVWVLICLPIFLLLPGAPLPPAIATQINR